MCTNSQVGGEAEENEPGEGRWRHWWDSSSKELLCRAGLCSATVGTLLGADIFWAFQACWDARAEAVLPAGYSASVEDKSKIAPWSCLFSRGWGDPSSLCNNPWFSAVFCDLSQSHHELESSAVLPRVLRSRHGDCSTYKCLISCDCS